MTTNFGKDTLCVQWRKTGRYATGTRLVGQRCIHRLITTRGQLRGGERDYDLGIGLPGLVGATVDDTLLHMLPAMIRAELKKDDQVLDVDAQVDAITDGGDTTWTITCAVQTATGPFRFVLQISEVTTKVLLD